MNMNTITMLTTTGAAAADATDAILRAAHSAPATPAAVDEAREALRQVYQLAAALERLVVEIEARCVAHQAGQHVEQHVEGPCLSAG